jgi:hypothetical protein
MKKKIEALTPRIPDLSVDGPAAPPAPLRLPSPAPVPPPPPPPPPPAQAPTSAEAHKDGDPPAVAAPAPFSPRSYVPPAAVSAPLPPTAAAFAPPTPSPVHTPEPPLDVDAPHPVPAPAPAPAPLSATPGLCAWRVLRQAERADDGGAGAQDPHRPCVLAMAARPRPTPHGCGGVRRRGSTARPAMYVAPRGVVPPLRRVSSSRTMPTRRPGGAARGDTAAVRRATRFPATASDAPAAGRARHGHHGGGCATDSGGRGCCAERAVAGPSPASLHGPGALRRRRGL